MREREGEEHMWGCGVYVEVCQSPHLEQRLQMGRQWSLHAGFPHLQQVLTVRLLLSVHNWHCFLHFVVGIGAGPGAGPAAALCASITTSAALEERGRRPRFDMCGFIKASATSSIYNLLLYLFSCFQAGSISVHSTKELYRDTSSRL